MVTDPDSLQAHTHSQFNRGSQVYSRIFYGFTYNESESLCRNFSQTTYFGVTGNSSSTGLRPVNNVIQVKFGGKKYPPEQVFETTQTFTSTSCLRVKKTFVQTSPGLSGGLQLIMFTGYPGLGQVPLYKALDRKPSLTCLVDPPDTLVSPQTTPINIKTGQRTSIMISAQRYMKFLKTEFSEFNTK